MRSVEHPRPWLALVGRPNVGKSTLFNRLLGIRKAVMSAAPGTTRDRLFGEVGWRGCSLTVIDGGGMELARRDGLGGSVQRQVRRLLAEADGFLLVCDAQAGPLPADGLIVEVLRRTGKPIILTVNKADHRLVVPPEFYALGLSEAFPVSALHGRGIDGLLDHLQRRFAAITAPPATVGQGRAGPREPRSGEPPVAVAIVGRQNVGKSSLLNALLREERAVVSEQPGTTRDAVDTLLTVHGTPVVLIDTAGLRHRRKVRDPVDFFAMSRTLHALARCDVALLLLDAAEGLTSDDRRIIAKVTDAGRGLVLLVNKWDLVKGKSPRHIAEAVHRAVPACAAIPVLAVSAATGFQVGRCLSEALRVARAMRTGLSDAACCALLETAWRRQAPPRYRGRPIRLLRARWMAGRPARLEVTTAPVGWLPAAYQGYLLKRVSAHPKLSGVPIRLVVRPPEAA